MADTPEWEPPLDGTEAEHLVGALERQRATFRWKADGLDEETLSRTVAASTLTMGGLLKHLACVEDEKWGPLLSGAAYGPPWSGMSEYAGDPKAYTFDTSGLSAAELYAMWDQTLVRSRDRLETALSNGGLAQQVTMGADAGYVVSLRRLLFDLLEEYGRHTGHADLIREAIDGRTGEDPPEHWRI